MRKQKSCQRCGNKFYPTSNRSIYCSKRCQFGDGKCKVCGRTFLRKSKTTGEYCSSRCWYNSGDFSNIEYKICSRCKKEKPISEFPLSGGKGKSHSHCRECLSDKFGEQQERQRAIALNNVLLDFPRKFREARIERQLTQRQVAEIFKVGMAQIVNWESGRSIPASARVRKIFEFFGWDIPLEAELGAGNRIPLGIGKCLNPKCGKDFPIYRSGKKFCSRKCYLDTQSGENNPAWGGGRITTAGGYIKIKSIGHPNADSKGYVLEHQLVMSEFLGRSIGPKERIHHKNGKRNDNRIENLELWTTDHKDPAGVRVSDRIVDAILSHPAILTLEDGVRNTIRSVLGEFLPEKNSVEVA